MRLRPRSLAPLFLLVGTAAFCWAAAAVGIRLNLTASMPLGVYRLSRLIPERGDLVAACLPESVAALGRRRGYLKSGHCPAGASPVIKRVAAAGGEPIQVTSRGVFVSGRRIQDPAPSTDSRGRTLESLPPGEYRLSSDQIWLYSPRDNSWDSRFYGPVSIGGILGTVAPIWTRQQRDETD